MTDILDDLRKNAVYCPIDTRIPILFTEAADEIEKLRADNAVLAESVMVLGRIEAAARMLSDSLNGGFVRCSRCGDQEDTTDMNYAAELREALSGHQQQLNTGE